MPLKDPKEMSNDEIHAELDQLKAREKDLKNNIKPIEAAPEIPLHVLNKAALDQRKAKFDQQSKIRQAVEMAITRESQKKVKSKSKDA